MINPARFPQAQAPVFGKALPESSPSEWRADMPSDNFKAGDLYRISPENQYFFQQQAMLRGLMPRQILKTEIDYQPPVTMEVGGKLYFVYRLEKRAS